MVDVSQFVLDVDGRVDVTVPHLDNQDFEVFIGDTDKTYFDDAGCCPFGYGATCRAFPMSDVDVAPTRRLEYDGACSRTGKVYITVNNVKHALSIRIRVNGGLTAGVS
jgi:hypothetical protein